MALFVRQDGGQSELQTKVAADLKERLKERAIEPQAEHEPTILENQHETKKSGIFIAILLFILLGVVIWWVAGLSGVF
jgi:hypothetical protein